MKCTLWVPGDSFLCMFSTPVGSSRRCFMPRLEPRQLIARICPSVCARAGYQLRFFVARLISLGAGSPCLGGQAMCLGNDQNTLLTADTPHRLAILASQIQELVSALVPRLHDPEHLQGLLEMHLEPRQIVVLQVQNVECTRRVDRRIALLCPLMLHLPRSCFHDITLPRDHAILLSCYRDLVTSLCRVAVSH